MIEAVAIFTALLLLFLPGCGAEQANQAPEFSEDPTSTAASLPSMPKPARKQSAVLYLTTCSIPKKATYTTTSIHPRATTARSPYALFVTLAGYEGLYFQGVGANLVEDFGFEAQNYNENMLVLAPQLNDWGETSARQTVTLVEYFLSAYNIDPAQVYLHGMSGGGETASLVMGMRPELFAACLVTSTRWDGDLNVLAEARTPVYMAIGEDDSYYGAEPLTAAYNELHAIYAAQGFSDAEIDELLILDVRIQDFFDGFGIRDQHAGGQAFAHDETVMGLAVFA